MTFIDRRDAGRRLAARLGPVADGVPVVVALPRGGVPVAVEVARVLAAPLDVLAVRKLGAPGNPEFAVGAVAEGGVGVVDSRNARLTGTTEELLQRTLERESQELDRRVEAYRDGRPPVDVRGRTVVIVDDGLATGLTDLAAVRALRRRGAARIVVAAPIGSENAVALLRREADAVVCHTVTGELDGVGRWYRDFSPVGDDEVVALLAGAHATVTARPVEVAFPVEHGVLRGELTVPAGARGLVLFAHGSGSSRHSPRNRAVAGALRDAGLATLLFDLLTDREEGRRDLVFDVPLLADRLLAVTRQVAEDPATAGLPIGYFGASTGAAAALWAAAALGPGIGAVVSRGGRPDLAAEHLTAVTAPTLLIVGAADPVTVALNREAAERLRCPHKIAIVQGAGHLFAEAGALEEVARLACDWFCAHLVIGRAAPAAAGA